MSGVERRQQDESQTNGRDHPAIAATVLIIIFICIGAVLAAIYFENWREPQIRSQAYDEIIEELAQHYYDEGLNAAGRKDMGIWNITGVNVSQNTISAISEENGRPMNFVFDRVQIVGDNSLRSMYVSEFAELFNNITSGTDNPTLRVRMYIIHVYVAEDDPGQPTSYLTHMYLQ